MYTRLNIVEKLEPDAEKFIMDNDRMLYLPFFERAEKFCADNSILLGGRVGIDILVGRPVTKDSFVWDLYCDDTFKNAKGLADALAEVTSPHVSPRTVALQTDIRHKEFTLRVNTRNLFKIYSMDRYRGIKLVELMGAASRTSYFAKIPIGCLSEEMQLIEIYRTLYSPKKISMWVDELSAEDTIYNLIKDSLGEKSTKEISGGADKINRSRVEELLTRKLIAGTNNVIIGDHALIALGLIKSASRLQFITEDSIDNIAKAAEVVLANELRKVKINNVKVTFVRYPLNIPSDFQITKYTLYINTGRDQIAIADIFNSSQFEMIPYWIFPGEYEKVKIGNPWVLLRFLLIDIWVLKLILNIGTDNPDFIKKRIKNIIDHADAVRTLARRNVTESPEKVFQLTNYVGVFFDEVVARKKMIKEIGERFPVYYPAKAIPASMYDKK
jgi:hypothetical protein